MVDIVQVDSTNTYLLDRVADVFDKPIDWARLAALVSDECYILIVAVSEGVVVGQCLGMVHRHPDKATELYIDDLAVDVSMQRRGIATRMVKALLEHGRRRGCATIWVATEPDNEAAQAFYASLGLTATAALLFERDL